MNLETPEILLATLNSTYQHTSFGLRYLYANLGADLQSRALIKEWTIQSNPRDVAEQILKLKIRIVGFGVYIWNTTETLQIVRLLKKVDPTIVVVLGGPEVSHEFAQQDIVHSADYLVLGEADFLFRTLCEDLLVKDKRPTEKIISGALPEIKEIQTPYPFYSAEDIKNRVIYVEASRGCPYKCEYCLSSLDKVVRNFPVDTFLSEMKILLEKGVRQFKFVDRTFNLSPEISARILQFFLDNINLGLFLHFEMVPDRLPDGLKMLIEQFPEGSLQFEIGVQTWNPEVAKNISRNQNYEKIRQNFYHLTQKTRVHIHADLIVGLPGETLETFAHGFNELSQLNPHEIQVGLLKRLKGTPITKKETIFGLVYQDHPPFQILSTKTMNFEIIQKLDRFSRVWNLVANQGRFSGTISALQKSLPPNMWFDFWWQLTEFFAGRFNQLHGIHPDRFAEGLLEFTAAVSSLDKIVIKDRLIQDYQNAGARTLPLFLRDADPKQNQQPNKKNNAPTRQNLHLKTKPSPLQA
ncbi:MAG: B12-binding domain-containing radical SAM protein [Bdellovibrionales bacterium]|nr:B12-binding domain-containing radical SAM protein [Bdellovibrionales bacterium]